MASPMDKYHVTFRSWDLMAERYQEYFMDLDIYDQSYDSFCASMPSSSPSILEIGCGPGNITRALTQRLPGSRITALDISPRMVELARQNCPQADFQVMDCRQLEILKGRYDGIVCGFTLPYLSSEDVDELIREFSRLLVDSGVLYLSLVPGPSEKSGFQEGSEGQKMYFYYHPMVKIHSALRENGFQVKSEDIVVFNRTTGSDEEHAILLASKVPHVAKPMNQGS